MNSQETPHETLAASSSRGITIPLEENTGDHGNRPEYVDIALRESTSCFKLEVLNEIHDPNGEYKVPLSVPQHDLPRPTVPDLLSLLTNEIVEQFYEAQFQRLDLEHACEDELEDYNNTDDDGDDDKN